MNKKQIQALISAGVFSAALLSGARYAKAEATTDEGDGLSASKARTGGFLLFARGRKPDMAEHGCGKGGCASEETPKGAAHSCAGKNMCKGQGGCSTDGSKGMKKMENMPQHACKGQNACKGQGGCASS